MSRVREIKAVILGLICILASFLSNADAQSVSDAYQTETFTAGDAPSVDIRTSGGHIEVKGHGDDEIRVEMYVRKGSRYYKPSDADLSEYEIDISQDGDVVTASASRESSGVWNWFRSGRDYAISFRVLVPERTLVEGRTSGGHISAENISNNVNLRTSGGHVRVAQIEGDANLRTSGGHIEIERLTGTVEARTSGGRIEAKSVDGDLDLRTSGGGITLNEISGSVAARTSGGTIRSDIRELTGDVNLRTSGGSIHIELPSGLGYDLDLRGNRVNVDLVNFTGTSERGRISGSMNGGGQTVHARTSGGSVNVNFSE